MTRPGDPNIIATMTDKALLEPAEYARLVIDVASEKQASDILMLDMAAAADLTDYFVIVSVDSTRQMRALVESTRWRAPAPRSITVREARTRAGGCWTSAT